jgi:integrase
MKWSKATGSSSAPRSRPTICGAASPSSPTKAAPPSKQIQICLGHASIQTTERYLGIEQDLTDAPCDHLGIRAGRNRRGVAGAGGGTSSKERAAG